LKIRLEVEKKTVELQLETYLSTQSFPFQTNMLLPFRTEGCIAELPQEFVVFLLNPLPLVIVDPYVYELLATV
jgi:hypothetical protein